MDTEAPDEAPQVPGHYDVSSGSSHLGQLFSSGRARPAKYDLVLLGHPVEAPRSIPISQALRELRS